MNRKMSRKAGAIISTVFVFTAVAGFAEKRYAGEEEWPYALWFDGDADYVDPPIDPADIDEGPITFSCRLLIVPEAHDDRMRIFSGYGSIYGKTRWDFEYNKAGNRYNLMFNEWGGRSINDGNRALKPGVWYYVNFVWDPGKRVTLYINGKKDASFTCFALAGGQRIGAG